MCHGDEIRIGGSSGGLEIQSSSSSSKLPAQDGGGVDKGEVIQGDCRGIIMFKKMAQYYREEGYGDHDTLAMQNATAVTLMWTTDLM